MFRHTAETHTATFQPGILRPWEKSVFINSVLHIQSSRKVHGPFLIGCRRARCSQTRRSTRDSRCVNLSKKKIHDLSSGSVQRILVRLWISTVMSNLNLSHQLIVTKSNLFCRSVKSVMAISTPAMSVSGRIPRHHVHGTTPVSVPRSAAMGGKRSTPSSVKRRNKVARRDSAKRILAYNSQR